MYMAILVLYPIQKYPRLLLLVVMVLVPLVFNTIQFWIIDEFLRSKSKHTPAVPIDHINSDMQSTVPGGDNYHLHRLRPPPSHTSMQVAGYNLKRGKMLLFTENDDLEDR